jgi:membrane-bound lytic murein transglycosylase D
MSRAFIRKSIWGLAAFVALAVGVELFLFGTKTTGDFDLRQRFSEDHQVFSVPVPADLSFAGERVPLRKLDVKENLEREFLVFTYWPSSTMLVLKRANRWLPVIEPILKKYGVPDDFKYIALVESGFTHETSRRGASGFWQFVEPTAKQYGLEVNDQVDERYHVEKSTRAACQYFLEAKKQLGTWTLAAASFNLGIGGISEQLSTQKSISYYDLDLNEETGRYLYRILAIKSIHQNPAEYGFKLRKKDLYPFIPTFQVKIDSAHVDMASFAQSKGVSFRILKLLNPWIRKSSLSCEPGQCYIVSLPDPAFAKNEGLENHPETFGFTGLPQIKTKNKIAPWLSDSLAHAE